MSRFFRFGVLFLSLLGCSTPSRDRDGDLRFWLENMECHRYTPEEMTVVTGLSPEEIARHMPREMDRARLPRESLLVLPYPGGRHPRTGFLDGAVDPHRDTKFSVFLPWAEQDYVVVDFPEALWSGRDLVYLAHTHIKTVWEKAGIKLPRIDWTRGEGGVLESRRVLPDGLEFFARVLPKRDTVDMELRLRNGTRENLAKLRTQVCVLLKGARDFNAQTKENKLLLERVAAVRSADGRRWIATVWDRSKTWQNPPCPCIHSDPAFPDLAPGEEAAVRGRLFFYEGDDLAAEVARREKAGTLNW